MANAGFVAVAMATLLVLREASTCAVARHHGKRPDPCSGEDDDGESIPGTLHKHNKRTGHCTGGTPGIMTVNGFQRREDGGGPAACDGKYHSDKSLVVARLTWWYEGGRRCHRPICITSRHNGRTVEAIVVDECDSRHGCKDDIVDTFKAVWKALGLDSNVGEVPVTWADA